MADTLQGKEQETYRALSGTSLDWNGDANAAFLAQGVTDQGNFNGNYIKFLQLVLNSTETNLSGLIALKEQRYGSAQATLGAIPNMSFWLDAADSSTIDESSGSVGQWNDKSGNSYSVSQSTGSRQPTTGVDSLNGKNVISFDGGDSLDSTDAGLLAITQSAQTMFVVAKRDTETGSFEPMYNFRTGAAANAAFMLFSTVAGNIDYRNNTSGTLPNTGNTNTDFQILRGRRNGTTQAIAVNGGAEATNNSGGDNASSVMYLGSLSGVGNFLFGDIAEVIFYNRSLSTAEISIVENYLSSKWGITI